MLTAECKQPNDVRDFRYTRIQYDVSEGLEIENKEYQVTDDMDFLGGIGRSFKILSNYETKDPFASDAPLILNTGCFTGTQFMTGLRTYFSGYSPIKRTKSDAPMPVWSAMSGCFGRKLAYTGIDDLVLTGRAAVPSILVIKQTDKGPALSLIKAPNSLIGSRVREKMNYLNAKFNNESNKKYPAHFAVIGPAGENWESVWYACVVGSTQEQLMSGEDKWRFAGRLGMGSVMGSKNILCIVAEAEKEYYRKGDTRLKAINNEIGRGEQSRGYRHPNNRDGLGGTGKNSKILDSFGVLPYKNFEPTGENLAVPVHLETMRESDKFIVIDKNCFGCQISCHQDFYNVPPNGKSPDPRKARKNHGDYLGRFEFEPMELSGANLGILDPHDNLDLARLDDDLGFDTISVNVVLAFLMDYNTRGGNNVADGISFGDIEGARRLKENIAYGKEPLFGKGVRKIADKIGGQAFAMHAKGVEFSAYLGQTNPGYPFAIAGGHMSMRTFLLYIMDPECKPESTDYWVQQICEEGWKMINKDLHGGCLFSMADSDQISESIKSIFDVPFTPERVLEATYKTFLLGFALEQKQGITATEYDMPSEVFSGQAKGNLKGANFLTRHIFEEVRDRVLGKLNDDVKAFDVNY